MTPKQFHDLAGSFPETEFATSHAMPSWKAFGKFFTRLRAENNSVVLGQVPLEERDMLCEADPALFHVTAHYKDYPYVLARLEQLNSKVLGGYLTRQWRHNAPKKWLKAWDAGETLPAIANKIAQKKIIRPRGKPGGRTK